jgi:hypothetical protein
MLQGQDSGNELPRSHEDLQEFFSPVVTLRGYIYAVFC